MKIPSEEKIISYLYGELSSEEMKEMEAFIAKDPELAREIEDMKLLRTQLGKIEDEEVVEPIFLPHNLKNNGSLSYRLNRLLWNPVVGIAATLLILFVLAVLFKVDADFSGDAVTISFGDQSKNQSESGYITRDEALQLVKNSASQQTDLEERFEQISQSQNAQFTALMNQQNLATEQIIGDFVAQLQKDNMVVIERFLELSQDQQEKYMQSVLTDFTQYLEEQRENDLQEIEDHLVNLHESQQVKNLETEELLAGIINTVNYQYQNE